MEFSFNDITNLELKYQSNRKCQKILPFNVEIKRPLGHFVCFCQVVGQSRGRKGCLALEAVDCPLRTDQFVWTNQTHINPSKWDWRKHGLILVVFVLRIISMHVHAKFYLANEHFSPCSANWHFVFGRVSKIFSITKLLLLPRGILQTGQDFCLLSFVINLAWQVSQTKWSWKTSSCKVLSW